jgi:hypothetical protein
MPKKIEHLVTSLILGLVAGLLIYDEFIYSLIFTLFSGVTAVVPDVIEKKSKEKYKGFFHSKFFFIILLVLLFFIIQNPVSGLVFGYLTHLLLEYARPPNKPLV